MKPMSRWVLAPLLTLSSTVAFAAFHTYQIEEIFSDASGTVQYVVMHESAGASAEYFWAGNHFTASGTDGNKVFTFPTNLPGFEMCGIYGCDGGMSTADTRVLIATQGFSDLGILKPDYVIPNAFIPTGGGTINYAGVDQVTFGPLPTDGVTAMNRNGQMVPNLATNFQGKSASVMPGAAGLNLNRRGLTGSWFQMATSGQGVELEVYPDLIAPGTGFLQGAWFTYDYKAVGGAASQRWYTFSGNVQTGQPSATLTLYENTGGNFDAGPVTNAMPVGMVVFSATDCSNTSMSYSFTDGSGRSGMVPMTRLLPNVTCVASGPETASADFGYSGNWFDKTTSGQGIVFELNPNQPLAWLTWYTYAPNGQALGEAGQRWYTAQAAYTPGARMLPMTLYETTGGLFDTGAPTPTTVPVGTATATFASCSALQLAFNFTGGSSAGTSGMINMTRVGPTPSGCGP
ncbi:MAG TPA: hypothetical protein VEN29_16020 [Casimicrobiaceae bacterium]|nr:hypothetical protein [Casimicrobiaceae bacterium]